MGHENSITVKNKEGKWVNLSSMVGGKQNRKEAVRLYNTGKRKALGGKSFSNSKAAEAAAAKRSASFDSKPHVHKKKPIGDLRKRKAAPAKRKRAR